jgi:hypothetical protein
MVFPCYDFISPAGGFFPPAPVDTNEPGGWQLPPEFYSFSFSGLFPVDRRPVSGYRETTIRKTDQEVTP